MPSSAYHSRNISAFQTQFYISSFEDGRVKFSVSLADGLRNMVTGDHSGAMSKDLFFSSFDLRNICLCHEGLQRMSEAVN